MSSDSKMLCMTIYSYKKAGLSDDDYRNYMLQTHAPLASTLMEKYGIVDFTMVRTYCLFITPLSFPPSRFPQETTVRILLHPLKILN